MTAKEMFEKIGYEQIIVGEYIYYLKPKKIFGTYSQISFGTKLKTIGIAYQVIDIEDLKAINQQCKELGWIESEEQ